MSKDKDYIVYLSIVRMLKSGTGTEISMKNLPNGLYFIKIDNVSYKILKNDQFKESKAKNNISMIKAMCHMFLAGFPNSYHYYYIYNIVYM